MSLTARLRRWLFGDVPPRYASTRPATELRPPPRGPAPGAGLTTDPTDPELGHGSNTEPVPQNAKYLVLSDDERRRGFVRPVRRSYVHARDLGGCGTVTTMGQAIAETYAADPAFYGATYCCGCNMHRPVGADGEFRWDDGSGQLVGT